MIAIDNKYMTSAAESLYLSNSDENVRKVALEREEFLRFQAFREKKIEVLEEQIDNLNGQVDASANVTTSATTKSKNMDSSSGYGFDTYNITEQQNTDETYVLNTSTLKIHHPNCKDVPKIKPSNYATSSESAETLISQGYSICGHCFK